MTITENFFKARGWEPSTGNNPHWFVKSETEPETSCYKTLPNITQSFPDFKKFVLEPIHAEGHYFVFETREVHLHFYPDPLLTVEIINNEILEAAVVAATRYFEDKK